MIDFLLDVLASVFLITMILVFIIVIVLILAYMYHGISGAITEYQEQKRRKKSDRSRHEFYRKTTGEK